MKSIKEARIPLKPGEDKILAMYPPAIVNPIRQSLDSLRRSNPNITIPQVAQQMLQTPQFQGNQQLTALSRLKDQDVQSSAQVGKLFAQNPVQRISPPPPEVLNYNKAQSDVQNKVGYDPVQYSNQLAQQMQPRQSQPRPMNNGIPQTNMNMQQPPALSREAQRRRLMGNKDTIKVEAFDFGIAGGELQKIMKVVSTLKPEEVQMLMKMLNATMGGQPQSPNSIGTSSMTRSTMVASQKYTKKQIVEQLKKDILKEELIGSIKAQTESYKLMESMLSEGPLSNVWQGLKNAGTSIFNKVKSIGDKTGLATGNVSPEEQSKAYSGELMKVIKKAHQTRQQFKSQVLKNAEIINAYHDAVEQVWNAFSHVADSLGPHSGQLKSQVDELVSNLKYDLESEKEQIQSFLQVLGSLRGNAPDSGMARGNAEFKRDQEAQAARRMKNRITGKRMNDSAVDPEIIKDTDKELVDQLVKKAMRGDNDAMEKLRNIQAPKMKAAFQADKVRKAAEAVKKTKEKNE